VVTFQIGETLPIHYKLRVSVKLLKIDHWDANERFIMKIDDMVSS